MRKVILSKRASSKLEKLLEYLEIEWSENVKQNFIRKLDTTLEIIKKYPESSEQSEIKKGLFRCVITKQTTLFYQYNSSTIKIVTLFDTRMNPKKMQDETK
jgi:plasmid stabilization system protein ParE